MTIRFIPQPNTEMSTLTFLQSHLLDSQWTHFRAAVAFAKRSGVRHIAKALRDFSLRADVNLTIGVTMEGSSRQGLQGLISSLEGRGKLWVFYNEEGVTFHPKLYLFKNSDVADVLIGSSNLTEGGLFSNYEASCILSLDLSSSEDAALLNSFEESLDQWSGGDERISKPLTDEFLEELVECYYVPDETEVREYGQPSGRSRRKASGKRALFTRVAVPKAPSPPVDDTEINIYDEELVGLYSEDDELRDDLVEDDFIIVPPTPVSPQPGKFRVFVMTLKKTDVGIGQLTDGKQRRSPEIFIPLGARDFDKEFWGWDSKFTEDPERKGKWDRRSVKMRIGTITTDVNMMTWPVKHDFRLRSEVLRKAGSIDDILRIERTDGEGGFSYYVEIIPQGTVEYAEYLDRCNMETRNSEKKWGYY